MNDKELTESSEEIGVCGKCGQSAGWGHDCEAVESESELTERARAFITVQRAADIGDAVRAEAKWGDSDELVYLFASFAASEREAAVREFLEKYIEGDDRLIDVFREMFQKEL